MLCGPSTPVDLVFLHEFREETHARVEVALVVVDLQLDGQLLAGDVDAAGRVHVVHPHLVGGTEVGLLEQREDAGDRPRPADDELVLSRRFRAGGDGRRGLAGHRGRGLTASGGRRLAGRSGGGFFIAAAGGE